MSRSSTAAKAFRLLTVPYCKHFYGREQRRAKHQSTYPTTCCQLPHFSVGITVMRLLQLAHPAKPENFKNGRHPVREPKHIRSFLAVNAPPGVRYYSHTSTNPRCNHSLNIHDVLLALGTFLQKGGDRAGRCAVLRAAVFPGEALFPTIVV